MMQQRVVSFFCLLILSCQTDRMENLKPFFLYPDKDKNSWIGDPGHHLAYRVFQEGNKWNWTFEMCGSSHSSETPDYQSKSYMFSVRIWYSEMKNEPLCSASLSKPYPFIWPHGEGLLARDGGPCLLGTGKYRILVSPDWLSTDFEITSNGDIRILGGQCSVPGEK